jgi:hypothetical protein
VLVRQSKRFFSEKKKQKTFAPAGVGNAGAPARSKRKFFASFFQKRSAFFPKSARFS